MPVVPTFENEARVDATPTAQRGDPQALSQPGAAVERGGAELSDVETVWAQRYAEARRQAQASDLVASGSKQLGDLQFKWSKVPDRAAATLGYNNDADAVEKNLYKDISDPLVRAHVQDRVSQERIIRGLDTQNASFQLESSKHRGDLDAHLFQFSQNAASAGEGATGDALRAKLTDDGIAEIKGSSAAGWIQPEEASQKELSFKSQIQAIHIRQQINTALDTQNADGMRALAAKVNDPSTFPGLLPQDREALGQHLETYAYRLDIREASRIAHNDAVADRNLRIGQAHNEAVLLAGVNAGKQLSDADIQQMADHGQITANGVEALHTARDRAEDGRDVPAVSLSLWHAVDQNQITANDVYDQFRAGHLSKNTATDMIKAIDAKNGKGDSAQTKASFNVLKTALSGGAVDAGVFGDKSAAASNWAAAQGEWNRRVVSGGENSDAVLSDMIPRYSSVFVKPSWLASPKFGPVNSTKDLMAVAAATVKAHQAKKLSDPDYAQQVELLSNYRRFYAEEDARAQAAAKARGQKQGGNGATLSGVSPGSGP
jgi:hypothetical protein